MNQPTNESTNHPRDYASTQACAQTLQLPACEQVHPIRAPDGNLPSPPPHSLPSPPHTHSHTHSHPRISPSPYHTHTHPLTLTLARSSARQAFAKSLQEGFETRLQQLGIDAKELVGAMPCHARPCQRCVYVRL